MNNITTRGLRAVRKAALLVLLAAATCQAIAQDQPAYETALLAYTEVTKVYDVKKMSESMHPEGLKRFRATIDAALRGPKKDLATTELLPLFSVSSAEEFAQLSDREAYERMNHTVSKQAPELVQIMSAATFEVVGSFVKEDIAYVTYKLNTSINGKAVSMQVVQTLKMRDGKWLLLLPSTAESSIAGIESRYQ